MKKYISKIMMLMALAIVCVTSFTSCGGDDDNDLPGGKDLTVGVHRIDVQFDGNFQGKWTAINSFYAIKPDGTFTGLYENGKALDINSHTNTWTSTEIRDFSISTENGAAAIAGSVMLSAPYGSAATNDINITMVGYINNKRVYTRVFTLPAGSSIIVISFSTDEGGKSGYTLDNGEVKG